MAPSGTVKQSRPSHRLINVPRSSLIIHGAHCAARRGASLATLQASGPRSLALARRLAAGEKSRPTEKEAAVNRRQMNFNDERPRSRPFESTPMIDILSMSSARGSAGAFLWFL